MNNNDVLRRVRYIFDFGDDRMMAVFAQADAEVSREQISAWLKKDDDPEFRGIDDRDLALFLNGLINDRRGKREGAQPPPEERLNNNIVLRKLRIALNLQAEDMLAVLVLADFRISKHELSAFFRKPGHKNYRACNDQVLRKFLHGLQIQRRGDDAGASASPW
jgi:uncharacterized protein YehS (DUF1456 family)